MTLAVLNGLIDFLTGSDWTYLLLFGICLGDAVLPILPSETAAIVCGIQAARGQLSLPLVLIVARFVPGGRTATTFTAGLVRLPWARRFVPYVAIAAVLWSSYAVLLGYLGGRTFRDKPFYALLLAFGIAFGITVMIEAFRRFRGDGRDRAR